jgi:hypothetical protein
MSAKTIRRSRLHRVGISLVAVLVAYAIYAVFVVQFVEPTATHAEGPTVRPPEPRAPHGFEKWFEQGSWERRNPKFLETEKGTLLFDECTQLENGNLELRRCALVSSLPPAADGSERPVILRAEGGAELMFDTQLDIARGRFGQLRSGLIRGRVTIDSPPSHPSKQDGLHIETTNLQINKDRIWAPGDVRFLYAKSSGSGCDLSIRFHPSKSKSETDSSAPEMGSIKSLELVQLNRLDLQLAGNLLNHSPEGPTRATKPGGTDARPVSIEVRCEGPFLFDFDRAIATLAEKVDVIHHGTEGPSDQLLCDLLEIHFGTDSEEGHPLSPSQPQRVVAVGYPATFRSPGRRMEARAERIELVMATRHLWLKDRQRVKLIGDELQLMAPEVEYQFDEDGGLGQFWAAGPGQLSGRVGADKKQLDVAWTDEVRLFPQANRKVLTIRAADQVALDTIGELSADELHLFLQELPPTQPGERLQIQLDRLQALGQVVIESPQLSARLAEARLWFRPATGQESAPSPLTSTGEAWPDRPRNAADPQPTKRYLLDAEQLHAEVVLGSQPQLDRLDVRGELHLRQEATGDATGISIVGEALELSGGTSLSPVVRLHGTPAEASLPGMVLVGNDMEVRPNENRANVIGAGKMTVVAPARNAATNGPPVTIQWAREMQFDGLTGQFADQVVARGSHRTEKQEWLRFVGHGDELDVTLSQRVDFRNPRQQGSIEVRGMRFGGSVFLENRLVTVAGQLKSFDQMQVQDLNIDQYTGNLTGAGPGWMIHRGQPAAGADGAPTPRPSKNQLQFLRVDFAKQMVGNIQEREVRFEDDIRCLFGFVADWQSQLVFKGRESLGDQDVLLTCRFMDVVEMGTANHGDSLELRATGNARIIGRSFSGDGDRLSYARGKDLLILEGDGRQDAILRFRKTPGTDPVELTVAKVLFHPSTKLFTLNDIRSLELPRIDRHLNSGR